MVDSNLNEDFDVEVKHRLGYALVIISGSFTVKNLFHIRTQLQDLVEDSVANIVFDLGGCTEIDSSGLGILSNLYKRLSTQGGELGVFNLTPKIQKILSETRLDNIFSPFQDLEEVDSHFDL